MNVKSLKRAFGLAAAAAGTSGAMMLAPGVASAATAHPAHALTIGTASNVSKASSCGGWGWGGWGWGGCGCWSGWGWGWGGWGWAHVGHRHVGHVGRGHVGRRHVGRRHVSYPSIGYG